MSNKIRQPLTNVDSDNEEFDCEKRRIPPEHLPLFQRLASVNGKINRMKRRQLIDTLKRKNLNVDGEIEVLKKRLKNHYRMQALIKAKICESEATYFPYFVVIDIEATCTEQNPPDYKYVYFYNFIYFKEFDNLYSSYYEKNAYYLYIYIFTRLINESLIL